MLPFQVRVIPNAGHSPCVATSCPRHETGPVNAIAVPAARAATSAIEAPRRSGMDVAPVVVRMAMFRYALATGSKAWRWATR